MNTVDGMRLLAIQLNRSELGIDGLPTTFGENNIRNGLTIAFGIAGGIALVIVAYGGLKYVLSQGNPQETSKAKSTIIDGLIGLAIIVTAGSIVAFVVTVLR